MPFCAYKVRNLEGMEIKGQCWCLDRKELFLSFRERGYYVINYEELNDNKVWPLNKDQLSLKELSMFCGNFSTLLSAGVNVVDIVSIQEEEAKNKCLKRSLEEIGKFLFQGEELSTAMGRSSSIYPDLLVGMIKVGEESGKLDKIFNILSKYYENENKIRDKIIKAMAYPCIVIVVSILIMIFMITTIIPMLVNTMDGISVKIPFITRAILNLSIFLKSNFISLFIVVILQFAAFLYIRNLEKTRIALDRFKIKNIITRGFYTKLISVRFSRTLGILLESGIQIGRALEITLSVIDNRFVKKEVYQCIEAVKRGEGISFSMEKVSFFPRNLISITRIGEETGKLDEMLIKAADIIDDDLYTTIDKLTVLIEPALIIGLSIIIGIMMIGVFMPMLNLMDSI